MNIIGEKGFQKLRNSCVLIAGVGGLGTVVSEILVRIGVGKLILVDNGIIDEPDLNRQFFYSYSDLGKFKVDVAKNKLEKIFPRKISPEVIVYNEKITKNLINKILNSNNVNAIIDCVDNFETKFLLDEISKKNKIFFVHGGVNKYFGQICSLNKKISDVYSNLETNNVIKIDIFPPICFIVGSLMASEVIKFITNKGEILKEKILTIDVLFNQFDAIPIK